MRSAHAKPFLTFRKVAIITFAVYALLVLLHLWLSVFTKTIDVLPDELRYLDITRSLAYDGTLAIRGDGSSFQKILYPLFLLPAMLTPDPVMQVEVISILNCFYACSLVFPVYFLGKRLFNSPTPVLACVVLSAAFPEICYSATFMSEVIYVPLTLWLTLTLWSFLDSPRELSVWKAPLCGALCFAAYLTKEVALSFLLAGLILMLLSLRKTTRQEKTTVLLNLALFLAGFCLPFAILKLTIFSGMGNSYNQMSLDVLNSMYTILYGFIALGANYTYLLVGFCILPLLVPLLYFRYLTDQDKTLTVLMYLCLVICFITVVYSISIREDIGYTYIRQHLRYLSCYLIPLVMITLKIILTAPRISLHNTPRHYALLVGTVAVSCAAIIGFYGTADLSQGFDTCLLQIHRELAELDGAVAGTYYSAGQLHPLDVSQSEGGLQPINWIIWLAKLVMVAATVGLFALMLKGSRKTTAYAFFTFVLALFMANTAATSVYNYNAYNVKQSFVEATTNLSETLQKLPNDAVVTLVYDDKLTLYNNLMDTFAVTHCRQNMTYTNTETINANITNGSQLNTSLLLNFGIAGNDGKPVSEIDYLVFNSAQKIELYGEGVRQVSLGYDNGYLLYQVIPNKPIYIKKTSAKS